jgi:nucleotidyltransferase substrate binding protein (TIGR01987 family)
MNKDIRWKQRFQNFEKSYMHLEQTVAMSELSELERSGLIKYFEITFELSWKLLKDYQESNGFVLKSPRDVFKQAFQSDLIKDGHTWMEALEDRNLAVHTYDEKICIKLEALIKGKYFKVLKDLYLTLKQEL